MRIKILIASLMVMLSVSVMEVQAAGEIIGHGTHQYRVNKTWSDLDAGKYPVKDCHAMVQDSQGRIVLLTNEAKNNILIYSREGKLLESWTLDLPGAHGLALLNEGGKDFLFITDYKLHTVVKATIQGEKVWEIGLPDGLAEYPDKKQYKPTDVVMMPDGTMLVCDGYGNGYLINYDKEKPEYKSILTGGKKIFKTPHGGTIDARDPQNPTLLIASRGTHSIKRISIGGEFLEEIVLPGAQCCDIMIVGDFLYIPNLNGFLSILDKDNKLVSQPGGNWPEFDEKGNPKACRQADETFVHPHNILVDDRGDIYVPQWNSGKSYPIKLERINPFKDGGCCDGAFKGNKSCSHPCCLKEARGGQVCKKCN